MNSEYQILFQMLQHESIITSLKEELNNIVNLNTLNYEIGFINSEYFFVNQELKAAPYEPEYEYIIEGNLDSKEEVIPPNAFRVTSILKPTRASFNNYFSLLNKIGVRKAYIQPFVVGQNVTLFNMHPQGGVIMRVGDVKEYDKNKLIKTKAED